MLINKSLISRKAKPLRPLTEAGRRMWRVLDHRSHRKMFMLGTRHAFCLTYLYQTVVNEADKCVKVLTPTSKTSTTFHLIVSVTLPARSFPNDRI
jgi:hypothetical protein